MASILSVGEIRGLAENSNTVTLPAGHTLDVSSGTVNGITSFTYPNDLPAGAVVQVQQRTSKVFVTMNAANTWLIPHTTYYVDITPVYSNSLIIVEYEVPINPRGSANILMTMTPIRSADAGSNYIMSLSDQGTPLGSRHAQSASWFRSSNGYDSNDMQTHKFSTHDFPGTTGTLRYSYYFRQESAQDVLFNHTNGDNNSWGWTAASTFKATEIKQ